MHVNDTSENRTYFEREAQKCSILALSIQRTTAMRTNGKSAILFVICSVALLGLFAILKQSKTSEFFELTSYLPSSANVITSARGSNKKFTIANKHISGYQHRDNLSNACTMLRFSSVPLPITALASIPGSGNTWSRHIIELITGKYLG